MSGSVGLVIGKFMPLHRGHQLLIDFARSYVGYRGELVVQVCSIPGEPIPGSLRYQWVRGAFTEAFTGHANVTVVHHDDLNPQEPADDPLHFWDIWRESLRARMDHYPDYVFASEPYGAKLAEVFGASFVPVDVARELVPVSGTLLRSDPLRYWDYLHPVTRPYFVKRIALLGPESSGKTTLARRLAERFQTVYATEYARTYLDAVPVNPLASVNSNTLRTIAAGQQALVKALSWQANRLLFSDTEAITTALWSKILIRKVPKEVFKAVETQRFDLYLLCAATEDWTPDPQRMQPDFADRKQFEENAVKLMNQYRYPFVRLTGTYAEREEQAISAVLKYFFTPTL